MLLSEIKPYEKNAKKHPKKQIDQVAASIKEFGFNQPIVVDKDGVIIVGHGRYEAAKVLGLEDVPVIQADLSPSQAKAYRLADNKLNESDWEMELVLGDLKDLEQEGYDVELTGFEVDMKSEDIDWASAFDKETLPKELKGLKQITFILKDVHIKEILEILKDIDKDKNIALYKLAKQNVG